MLLVMVLGLMFSFVSGIAQAQENFVIVVEEQSPTTRIYTFQPAAIDGTNFGPSLELANQLLAVKGVELLKVEKNQIRIVFAGVTSKEIDKEITWTLKRFFGGKNMCVVQYTAHSKRAFRAKLENALYNEK